MHTSGRKKEMNIYNSVTESATGILKGSLTGVWRKVRLFLAGLEQPCPVKLSVVLGTLSLALFSVVVTGHMWL